MTSPAEEVATMATKLVLTTLAKLRHVAGTTGDDSDVTDGEDEGSGEDGTKRMLEIRERCRSFPHCSATVQPHTNLLQLSSSVWRVVKL
jgi:hypothetical protein